MTNKIKITNGKIAFAYGKAKLLEQAKLVFDFVDETRPYTQDFCLRSKEVFSDLRISTIGEFVKQRIENVFTQHTNCVPTSLVFAEGAAVDQLLKNAGVEKEKATVLSLSLQSTIDTEDLSKTTVVSLTII